MTEYDYSPEAWERFLATQDRIARWVDGTKHAPLCNAFAPATPHLEALALKEQQRKKDRRRRRDYGDEDSDASIDTEYEQQRQRRRRERQNRPPHTRAASTWHPERVSPILEREDFVFVSRPATPTQQMPTSTHSSPTKPKMSRASPFMPSKSRKVPPPLALDLPPFPTSGIPPQDPYSYRNSGHSSQSSNTTPTSATYTNFPAHQLPFPPHSASPASRGAPKPMRSQTMPMQPPAYPAPPGYQQSYPVNSTTGHPVMVPLRPDMKGYASYGADPAKNPQLPWSEYTSPPTSTKSPSLLKRMFTGFTGQKQSRSQPPTPPIPSQYSQYPIYAPPSQYPQKAQYPQSTYPQQQYPMQPQYAQPLSPPFSASPAKPRRKDKDSAVFSGNGKRMHRKRSQSLF